MTIFLRRWQCRCRPRHQHRNRHSNPTRSNSITSPASALNKETSGVVQSDRVIISEQHIKFRMQLVFHRHHRDPLMQWHSHLISNDARRLLICLTVSKEFVYTKPFFHAVWPVCSVFGWRFGCMPSMETTRPGRNE